MPSEHPLLQAGGRLGGGVGVGPGRRRVGVVAVALVGDIERVPVGEPDPERERRSWSCSAVGKPFSTHMLCGKTPCVCRAPGCSAIGEVGSARRGSAADAVRAGLAGRVDEVHRVDAVAAAALREVDDVVEHRQAAEVRVLADLVGRVAELGDVEAADRRRLAWVLGALRQVRGGHDLRARADDHAVRLRVPAVAGVARGVDDIGAVAVIEDRGAAVVAAVGVGQGEAELAAAVELGDHAVVAARHRVRRVDDSRRVGVGHIERVRPGEVAHERHVPAVGRQVERQLGLGREARDHRRSSPGRQAASLFGTSSELTSRPSGVSWSRKICDVMPKLASTMSLLNTVG